MQHVTNPVSRISTECRIFPSCLTLSNASSFLTRWVQMIFSILLQHFPGISDLLSTVSKFQHHTELYSNCSILLASSLNFSPICCWKEYFLVESCCCHGNPGFNFMCTPCIICYHANQTAESAVSIWRQLNRKNTLGCHLSKVRIIYFGILRYAVSYNFAGVSKESAAFIFRVEQEAEVRQ